ncbi:MAG: site-specific integrase [Clostridia bacterium]|nr:site-specific integrase [Clostridia bacterium]
MSMMEPSRLVKPCIMEGYGQYLLKSKKMPKYKAEMYVNLVRKFHNHVGKPYVDVEQRDIRCYLFFLGETEELKDRSLYIHLAAIKKFYEYLWSRGDVAKIPSDGVTIKDWQKCRHVQKI